MASDNRSVEISMTSLRVQHSYYRLSHFCDPGTVKKESSFCFVAQGRVSLTSMQTKLEASAGELFYLPDGIRYNSVWTGSPDIEYYLFHIRTDDNTHCPYGIGLLPGLGGEETLDIFRRVYTLLAGDAREKTQALSLFYAFYAQAMDVLTAPEAANKNPTLLAAMAYIEKNCARDFAISELATHCHLSESRLYHLFRDELDTTPVGYRNDIRVEKAAHMLRKGSCTVDEILAATGFHSPAYFRETFRARTGMTPRAYRNAIVGKL